MALETEFENRDESKIEIQSELNRHVDEVHFKIKSDFDESGCGKECELEKGSGESQEKAETEASEKGTKEAPSKDKDGSGVTLPEYGFTVTIQPPYGDSFEVPVSSAELVQEIHQVLMDREDTSHRTCFSLYFNDMRLDNFSELKSIEGLKDGSVIRIQEEPYTVREAKIHLRHVRDLLKSQDPIDAYNGADGASLAFLTVVTQGDVLEKKRTPVESVDCTPPDFILPGCADRLLTPMLPMSKEQKSPQCLKVLTMSGWNPPPGPRKMHGDLMYLSVITMEGKQFNITASTWGYYLNQSTECDFNPKPVLPCYVYHSLIELLNFVSPTFKRNFSALQKRRVSRHPFERVATPYQLNPWLSPPLEHPVDALRAEDAFSSRLGYEEHIPGQTRDWNEELQTTRELPRRTLAERMLRERAVFKVHSDFVSAATRGAVAVVDGNVMAINPGEDYKMQMYIWNNIFFSLGFDVKDHYKDVGGDAAAYVAPRNDLQGVRVYATLDQDGLYTLGTVVVDYRGYRVTAQSIIPGILEKEQDQSVVYGSIDFGKTVKSHPKYVDILQKAGMQLKILPHQVLSAGEEIELCSSVECKGIIGNDSRHYILDLLRTFPPDVNFLPLEGVTVAPTCCELGFPIRHRHQLATLRQELIEAFVDNRYIMFLKHAALNLKNLGAAQKIIDSVKLPEIEGDIKDNRDVAQQMVEAAATAESLAASTERQVEENTREVIRAAAAAVGSLKEADFDVRFNPDVYSPGVVHPTGATERLQKERQLVCDAAEFLVTVQLPGLVHDLLDHGSPPTDGSTLCELMHSRGINLRYLGKVADRLARVPTLSYVHVIAIRELIVRSVRHIFREYLQCVESICMSLAVSHFLNCLLSSCVGAHVSAKNDELLAKRKRKKNPFSGNNMSEWTSLTPKALWAQIKSSLKEYYDFDLEADSVEAVGLKLGLHRATLLRAFCRKCGIQVLLRDYNWDGGRGQETFREDDIMNLYPVVKHLHPRATDGQALFEAGQSKIQQGFLKDGYDLVSEAMTLFNHVYGVMHPEIVQCLCLLARLNYVMGDFAEALSLQQKAVLMCERVCGFDHAFTVNEYSHLALYCFANQQVTVALKLLYRARYLLTIIHGEVHPEMARLDANIGLILHAVGQYALSLQFLEKALDTNSRFYGATSLKVALGHHLVARTQSCLGDFRAALRHEKETFAIYKSSLGPAHEKTREADECLRHLTQQAVTMAKKISEAFNGRQGNGAALPPIQIQCPTLTSLLELLNVINGILYVRITPAEIERVRLELEKEGEGCEEVPALEEGLENVMKIQTEEKNEVLPATASEIVDEKKDNDEDDDGGGTWSLYVSRRK